MATAADTPAPPAGASELPGMGYRAWFLLMMILVSASVNSERYLMVVLVEPIRKDLGLSDTAIGFVKDFGIAIVYVLAVIPLARLADSWSKRKITAIACAVWSCAILVCGVAKNFWVLLIGRMGIGFGEGGYTPASQAWIADLFPVRQRATALSIFLLGASAGTFAGPAIGGILAAEYGWRNTLLMASIPGFILAPLVWLTLRDTPAGLADGQVRKPESAPFLETARRIWAVPTLPPLILAAALNSLLTMGLISWAPAFMERSHGMPAQTAGLQMGGALFMGSLIGHSIGGPLADWLGRRDLRWYVWILMGAGAIAAVTGFLLLNGPAERVFPMFGINMLVGGLSAAPLMALVAGIAPKGARATTVAVLMVAINVIGLGTGPVVVGLISDLLRPSYGEHSLGVAMQWVLLIGIPSTLLAWQASRHVRADFAAAGIGPGGLTAAPAAAH